VKKKFLYLLFVLSLAAATWFTWRYFNSPAYFLSKLPLKYRNYPTLGQKVTSAHHEIKTCFKGKVDRLYEDILHKVVIISGHYETVPGSSNPFVVYYRFNSDGALLDSLKENTAATYGSLFAGHLLYHTYYTDYPMAGGLKKLPYVDINTGMTMNHVSLQMFIDSLSKTADAIDDDDTQDKEIILFYVKGRVHRLFVPGNLALNYTIKHPDAFIQLTPLTNYKQQGDQYDWGNSHSLIRIDYFLKEEYNPAHGQGYMASAPNATVENWAGTGYFSIPFAEDTLHFRHPFYYYPGDVRFDAKSYYENFKSGELDLFDLAGFNFRLLTVGYGAEDQYGLDGCYLILPKRGAP